jgi:hypothetical protein
MIHNIGNNATTTTDERKMWWISEESEAVVEVGRSRRVLAGAFDA